MLPLAEFATRSGLGPGTFLSGGLPQIRPCGAYTRPHKSRPSHKLRYGSIKVKIMYEICLLIILSAGGARLPPSRFLTPSLLCPPWSPRLCFSFRSMLRRFVGATLRVSFLLVYPVFSRLFQTSSFSLLIASAEISSSSVRSTIVNTKDDHATEQARARLQQLYKVTGSRRSIERTISDTAEIFSV